MQDGQEGIIGAQVVLVTRCLLGYVQDKPR